MNATKKIALLLLALCIISQIIAQPGKGVNLKIRTNTLQELSFGVTIDDFSLQESGEYLKIKLDGTYEHNEYGFPNLPIIKKIIAVPENANPILRYSEKNKTIVSLYQTFGNKKIEALQHHQFKNKTSDTIDFNKKIYSTNDLYKKELVNISYKGIYRNMRLYCITISPFEYNPVKNELLCHKNIDINITFENANVEKTKQLLLRTGNTLITNNILNKNAYKNLISQNASIPPRYIIVAQDTFRNTLKPFVEWKKQVGYAVEEFFVPQNFNSDSIRQYLKSLYDNSTPLNPAPAFIAIIGDTLHIPSFAGKINISGIGSHHTDLYYAEYTDDFYPEALCGRISVEDTTELRIVLTKILSYERFCLQDTSYLNNVLLVAGREDRPPATTTTNGQINYLKHTYFAIDTNIDTACFYNPESQNKLNDIVRRLSTGNSLVNYTAHCNKDGWLRPNLSSTMVDTLNNFNKYFFAVNNCCLSNKFTESQCFGETLLRRDSAGAISVIGASNETLWNEDYYWSVGAKCPISLLQNYDSCRLGAFDRMFHANDENYYDFSATAGQILQAGNFAVSQAGSIYENYYWEIYNLLGDPSTTPYIGIPKQINLSFDDSLAVGTSQINIIGPPFARISILQDTVLQTSTILNANGFAKIELPTPLSMHNLVITATAQFYRPFIDTMHVFKQDSAKTVITNLFDKNSNFLPQIVTAGKYYIFDADIANTGNDTAQTSNIGFFSIDGKCTILNLNTVINNISNSDTLHLDSILRFLVNRNVANGDIVKIKTYVITNNDTSFEKTYSFIVQNSDIKISPVEFWKNGNPTNLLQTDSLFTLKVPIVNIGANLSDTLNIKLFADTNAIKILSADTNTILPLLAQNTDTATFQVKIDTSVKKIVQLTICLSDNDTTICKTNNYTINTATETFENGNFKTFSWDTTHVNTWIIDTVPTHCHNGNFCAKSYPIIEQQTSKLKLTLNVLCDDSISFYLRTSTERGGDYFHFYIDNNDIYSWSGEKNWEYFSFFVNKGIHTFTWQYDKDGSQNNGNDCVWIDDIQLPFSQLDSTYTPTEQQQLNNITFDKNIKIYPNPAKDLLKIENTTNEEFTASISTILGSFVDKITIKPFETIYYKTTNLRSMAYVVYFKSLKKSFIKKILITK